MRIKVRLMDKVGREYGSAPKIEQWPYEMPIPRIGETIFVLHEMYEVVTVSYYPFGEDDPEPFIYVVAR